MKRIISIFIVITMLVAMSACDSQSGTHSPTTATTTPPATEPLADFDILGEWIIADDGLAVVAFNEDGTCIRDDGESAKYKVDADIAVLTIYYSTPQSYNIEKVGEYYRLTGEHFLLREGEIDAILRIAEKQKQYEQAVNLINNLPVEKVFSVDFVSVSNLENAAEAYAILADLGDYRDAETLLSNFVVYGILQKNNNENEGACILNIVQESDTYTYEYDDEGNIVADAYTAHVMYSTGQEKTYEYSNAYSYSYHTAYWYKQP